MSGLISRRHFLVFAGAAGAGLSLAGCSDSDRRSEPGTAIELLDRQHGVLRRAIAIMEEVRGGMDARMDLPPEILQGTIEVLRQHVDFHHAMEEKYIYPVFSSANKMSGLIGVLREQHAAGAQLVEFLRQLAADFSAKDLEKRRTLGSAVHHFGRMYRAHSDREDTVLFPTLHSLVTAGEYAKFGKSLLDEEAKLLGRDNFAETVQKLAGIEDILGMGDLSAFTPRIEELR